ncbi:MAG TPA: alpha/beta fold hydrolase [Gemmatimonadales bacterium]|nr:alpha/beta fold hydrolase [Gemmatimonadales bacterium]
MTRASARVWALRTVFRTVGPVAPGLAARWAETLFCTPPRHQPRPAEEAFLASGQRSTVGWEGGDLAVWGWGKGPTVLLVHGWGSRAARFGTMASALVARGFRAVAYDGPGHGLSAGRFASLPEFARALGAVGAATGPLHGLVGHSLGGAAIAMALGNGLEASRVVLLAPPADVRIFSDIFAETLAVPRRVQERMHRNLETRLRMTWADLDIPALVRRLSPAALVIHDRDDADVPIAHGERIAEAWRGARLVRTAGLGHRALLRDPAVVRRTVDFLAGERHA